MAGKDYYKSLGVDKSASKEDIKKAFRKLAHEHHPDKGGNQEKFKEISEAYSVLSDDSKRAQYDQFGSAGSGFGGASGNTGGFNAQDFGGFDFSGFGQNGQGFEFDLGDIFGEFFGGGNTRQKVKKGRDIQIDLDLTFAESVFGAEKEIRLTKVSNCKVCGGSGASKGSQMETCSVCKGAGKVRQAKRSIFGNIMTESVCENCGGSGKIPKVKCHTCHGAGVHKTEEKFSVKIPSDVNNGETIRLTGAGEAIKDGQSGDLYIRLHVKKDSLFEKEGKNIITNLNIKLSDALLGGKFNLKTLDGEIELKIPEGTQFGEILRVKGKGIPNERGGRGDLLVNINIKIPNKLSKDTRKVIEDLKKEGI